MDLQPDVGSSGASHSTEQTMISQVHTPRTQIEDAYREYHAAYGILVGVLNDRNPGDLADAPRDQAAIKGLICSATRLLSLWAESVLDAHPVEAEEDEVQRQWMGIDGLVLLALGRRRGDDAIRNDGSDVPRNWCESLSRVARHHEQIEAGQVGDDYLAPGAAVAAINSVVGLEQLVCTRETESEAPAMAAPRHEMRRAGRRGFRGRSAHWRRR